MGRNHPGIEAIGPGVKVQKGKGMACSQNTITVRCYCSKGQGGGLQRPGPEGLNAVLRFRCNAEGYTEPASEGLCEPPLVEAGGWTES